MTKLILVLILGIAIGASGCAGLRQAIPKQLPETMKAACDLYTNARPDVLQARAWAADHWDQVPENIKPTLLRLDAMLPQLDEGGKLFCAFSAGLNDAQAAAESRKVDWDAVLSTVMKTITYAVQLKQQGLI